MPWRKSPQSLIDTFLSVVPGPPAAQRQMFGFPAAFVNGNMFMGLFQEDMILRLPEDARAEFLAKPGAKIFEPMAGRPMREYVVVPPALIAERKDLSAWIARALAFGSALKPKAKPKTKTKKSVSKKSAKPKKATKTKGR